MTRQDGDKTAIRQSQSANSLQLNELKLAATCIIMWWLTMINPWKSQICQFRWANDCSQCPARTSDWKLLLQDQHFTAKQKTNRHSPPILLYTGTRITRIQAVGSQLSWVPYCKEILDQYFIDRFECWLICIAFTIHEIYV